MATARAIRRAYDQALGDIGLTLPEASLLAYIAEVDPQTQTRLAERLAIGKAALGARIDRLEQMDAIQRRPPAPTETRQRETRIAGIRSWRSRSRRF